MKGWLVGLLLLGVVGAAGAREPVSFGSPEPSTDTIIFYTDPPGADVYLDDSSNRSSQPDLLGKANTPIPLPPGFFSSRLSHGSTIKVQFKLKDHVPTHLEYVDADTWQHETAAHLHRWPLEGDYRLQPDNAWVALLDEWHRRRPWYIALAVLAVFSGIAVRRRGRQQQQALQRASQLESYRVVADREDKMIAARLGAYRITRRLGAGAMAVVYAAVPDETLDETQAVAIKVVSPEVRDDDFASRFVREVQICQQLDHPNIVRILDWSTEEPLYMVMELIEGQTLADHAAEHPYSLGSCIELARPLLSALESAHQRGIVHRDLKPENIMLTARGLVKVMDFGLARSQKVDVKLTKTGTALGTPAYMAPEQIAGNFSPASDQYSAGLVLYELLAGCLPYPAADLMETLMNHLTEAPRPLSEYCPAIPQAVEDAIMKMIRKEPSDRFASVIEALAVLEQAAHAAR